MIQVLNDVETAKSVIGKSNNYFKDIWLEFASGWDEAPCSEIACCISYLAGNIDTIPVSNYAEGLVYKFKELNRFGNDPKLGAFIFFTYDGVTPEHTGRVVEIKNNIVSVVEGNINNEVVERYYYIPNTLIYGYGYPDYEETVLPVFSKEDFWNYATLDISLYNGCNGFEDLVWKLQQILKEAGLYEGDLDGVFGLYTRKAVIAYQTAAKEKGIYIGAIDGIVGTYTWRALTRERL